MTSSLTAGEPGDLREEEARAAVAGVVLVSLVAAAASLVPWGRALVASDPASLVVSPELLRPEPVEGATFAVAAAIACLLPWALSPVLGTMGPARRGWTLASGVAALLLVGGTVLARPGGLDAGGLRVAPLVPCAIVVFVLTLVLDAEGSALAGISRRAERLGHGAALFGGVFVVLLTVLGGLLTERSLSSWGWAHTNHLASFLGPLTEAAAGKTVFVDLDVTYGAYAQLLAPLAALAGPRLLLLSGLFALLRGLSALLLWGALRRVVRRRWLADLAFVGIGGWSLLPVAGAVENVFDPYLQYRPLRTLFPALALWLLARWVRERRPADRVLLLALCPVAVLWNADSGLAVTLFVGAGLALSSPRPSFPSLLGWGAAAVAAVGAGGAAYSAFAFLRTGVFPPPWSPLATGSTYVRSGFMLLPLPALGPWLAIAATYAAVLGAVAVARARGKAGPTRAYLGATAVLGTGLFVYYQGRSHDANLPSVIVPALVIGAVLLDRFLGSPGTPAAVEARLRPALALLVAVPLLGALGVLQGAGPMLEASAQGVLGVEPPSFVDVAAQARFLARETRPGTHPLVLSHFAWLLHARAGTSTPLRRAALAEFLEVRELDELRRLLRPGGVDEVFVGSEGPTRFFRAGVAREIDGLLRSGFRPARTSEDGGLVLCVRKGPGPGAS